MRYRGDDLRRHGCTPPQTLQIPDWCGCSTEYLPVPAGDGWWSLVPIWEPDVTPNPLRRREPPVPFGRVPRDPSPHVYHRHRGRRESAEWQLLGSRSPEGGASRVRRQAADDPRRGSRVPRRGSHLKTASPGLGVQSM
jgi:hypothetical protein